MLEIRKIKQCSLVNNPNYYEKASKRFNKPTRKHCLVAIAAKKNDGVEI